MTEAESNRRLAEALWKYLKPKITKLSGTGGSGSGSGSSGDSTKRIYRQGEQYYLSYSNTELSGGEWLDEVPVRPMGRYIWHRWVIYYTDGTKEILEAVCVTGDPGDAVSPVQISSVVTKYYLSTSIDELKPAAQTASWSGDWQTGLPDVTNDTYLWYQVTTTYTNGEVSAADPVCVSAMYAKASTPAYNELSFLIESAEKTLSERVETLEGSYVSSSEWGEFKEQLNATLTTSAEGIQYNAEAYAQLKGDLDNLAEQYADYIGVTAGYVKAGVVYFDGLLPVMGIAIGQDLTTTEKEVNGVTMTVIDETSFRAIFTAQKLSFFLGEIEVASFDNNMLRTKAVWVEERMNYNGRWVTEIVNGHLIDRWIGGTT